MNEAQIIEEVKQIVEKGIANMDDEQTMAIIPKINSAINMYCVDKIIELTKMDEQVR